MGVITSKQFFDAVRGPLGLPPMTRKVVIEAEVGQVLKVYVAGFVDADAVPAIVAAVSEVSVSEKADVAHVLLAQAPAGR